MQKFLIIIILVLFIQPKGYGQYYGYIGSDSFNIKNPAIGDYLTLYGVLWDLDKASFRCEGLDTAAYVLNSYPWLVFQLENHTDCRASQEYNRGLSQRRADTIRARLLSKLKDSAQLPLSIGMGENNLLLKKCSCDLRDINNLCTEWEHQQNRRTILRVIGFKSGYYDSLSARVKVHAEGILNNTVTPYDDLLTSACLDSLKSTNKEVRDYYFKAAAVIADKSDGALSEAVGVYLKSYLDNYPAEFFKNYKSAKIKQQDDLLFFIAFEFYLETEKNATRYDTMVEKYFTNLLINCSGCKKYKRTVKKVKAKLLEKY